MVATTKTTEFNFYNYNKILSYNAYWNFVVGPRGNGKTYGAKKKAIRDFISKGREFIYVRRYKEELGLAKDAFFDDLIVRDEFPDWDFRTNGRLAQMAPRDTEGQDKRPWVNIGYFVALSTGQSYKSVPFPNVWNIIFDEFILEKSGQHYLRSEADVFRNFYNTVDRGKDQARVFFLANAISIMNPYFLDMGIKPDEMGEIGRMARLHDGTYYVAYHFIKDSVYAAQMEATKFGQFNKGTTYGDYANHAEFSDNHHELIEMKPEHAKPALSIESPEGTFSIWQTHGPMAFYCQAARPAQELLYTLDLSRVAVDKPFLSYSDKMAQVLRAFFNTGRVKFDSPQTRNMFIHIFKR